VPLSNKQTNKQIFCFSSATRLICKPFDTNCTFVVVQKLAKSNGMEKEATVKRTSGSSLDVDDKRRTRGGLFTDRITAYQLDFHWRDCEIHLRRLETSQTGEKWCYSGQMFIFLHCVSFTNACDDFFGVTLTSTSELNYFPILPHVQKLILSKKRIKHFITQFKCMFFPNFSYFHLSFYRLHTIFVYPVY